MKIFFRFLLAEIFFLAFQPSLFAQPGGSALKLNGTDDYVDAGTTAATQIANNLTITAWIKPLASTGWRDILTNQWKINQSGIILAINGATGQLHYAATGTNISYIGRDPVSNTLDGNWHHVALTLENGVFKTYLDGKLIDTYNSGITGILYSGGYKFLIGRDSGEGGEYFNGSIDEVSIWNVVRTEAQIKAGMYKELAGNESGLVSYYQMNEGTGVSLDDASSNSNTATLVNGPSWNPSGAFAGPRQALDFDGTNDAVLANNSMYATHLSNGTAITIEFWYKGTQLQSAVRFQDASNRYIVAAWSSPPQFIIQTDGGVNGVVIDADANLENNQWHHIACVWEKNTINGFRTYVDGILKNQKNSGNVNLPDYSNPLQLGIHLGSEPLQGQLDEVRIWKVARTETEIKENIMKTLAGNETGLVGYYRFDQIDGNTLFDMSSYGYNGTLTNMDPANDWVSSSAFNTWIGAESSNWNTAANWSNGSQAANQSIGIYKWNLGYEANLTGSPAMRNLLISSDANPSLSSNFTASGNFLPRTNITLAGGNTLTTAASMVIENGKTLTIPDGGRLTVSGTLTNNAGATGLIIESGGSLINSSANVSATVKRAIPSNEWHLISSPITEAQAGIFAGYYLQRHSEPDKRYYDITELTDPLVAGTGYALYGSSGLSQAVFTGILNTGSIGESNNLSRSGAAVGGLPFVDDYGWNLLGNPYPSSIDWLGSGWTKNNVENAIYIHRSSSTWATFAGGVGNNGGSQYIAPGQGFFVHMTDAGAPYPRTGTVTMTDAVRVHNNTSFYKNEEPIPDLLRLKISGNGYDDETVVRFLNEATAGFDSDFDARKLYGDVAEAAQIYTLGDMPLSINALPASQVIPVGVKAGVSGTFSISATEINDLPYVTLEDTKTGIFTQLGTIPYTFNYISGESETRFLLHFSALSTSEEDPSDICIHTIGRKIILHPGTSGQLNVSVYAMDGKCIKSQIILNDKLEIQLPAAGTYVLKIANNAVSITKKVVVL